MALSGSKPIRRAPSRSKGRAAPAVATEFTASRTSKTSRFQCTLASDYAASREIQKAILDDIATRGFNGQSVFAVKLALEEALINAIKHGNRFASHKKVQVQAKITNHQAEIVIEDEGNGFDRSRIPDPTLLENLEKCCGRGILLIESYMSSVQWSRNGRRLQMVKKNEADVLPRR